MATLWMMYLARGGLVWGHMRGCYLKSGGLHPLGGLYNLMIPARRRVDVFDRWDRDTRQ